MQTRAEILAMLSLEHHPLVLIDPYMLDGEEERPKIPLGDLMLREEEKEKMKMSLDELILTYAEHTMHECLTLEDICEAMIKDIYDESHRVYPYSSHIPARRVKNVSSISSYKKKQKLRKSHQYRTNR